MPDPGGLFYVFPDIRDTGMTSQQFTDHLIERHSVGVVAGSAFGDRGEGHIRLTYAAPDAVLEEGLQRIRNASRGALNRRRSRQAGRLHSGGAGSRHASPCPRGVRRSRDGPGSRARRLTAPMPFGQTGATAPKRATVTRGSS